MNFDTFNISEDVHFADVKLPLHAHEEARLIVVLAGDFLDRAGGASRQCHASTVIFRAAGEEHDDVFLASRNHYVTARVDPAFAGADLPRRSIVGTTRLSTRLAVELRRGDALARTLAAGLMLQIGAETLRLQTNSDAVRRARHIILDRFAEPLRIAAIAAESGLAPFSLTRAFKNAYGCTPSAFLLETRIRNACRELSSGRRSLSEVAIASGFYDQSHFCNAFKRIVGITPTHYLSLV